jgi:hypothetical protein
MKHHFRFHIFDAKQLTIAMTGAFSTWAATGFQHDMPHLGYILVGFITGGLVSHESMADPNITPPSHIATPYLANIDDGGVTKPIPSDTYQPEGADIKKVIKINSGLVKE